MAWSRVAGIGATSARGAAAAETRTAHDSTAGQRRRRRSMVCVIVSLLVRRWSSPTHERVSRRTVVCWRSSPAAGRHAGSRWEHEMERKTAHDFDQEVLLLFDAYVHGAIDRRGF